MRRVLKPSLILLLFTGVIFLLSCNNTKKHNVCKSFYYWKTVFNLDKAELASLNEQGIKKLYLRFFDVDYSLVSSRVVPLAPIVFNSHIPDGIEMVPVVFIVPDAFEHTPDSAIGSLAGKICSYIRQTIRIEKLPAMKELQLDCDWNSTIKNKFFALLNAIRHDNYFKNIILSATIRLHQLKYIKKCGVPPVDRGMLMYYNMGNLKDVNARNSIYDEKAAESYIGSLEKYPLKLDFALPLFSWGVVFHGKAFCGLIRELKQGDLQSKNFNKVKGNTYEVNTGCELKGIHLPKGSFVRLEEVSALELNLAKKELLLRIDNDSLNISLFHLDMETIKKYTNEEISSLYTSSN